MGALLDSNRMSLFNLVTRERIVDIRDYENQEDLTITDLEVEMSSSYLVTCFTCRDGYEYDSPVIEVDITLWDKWTGEIVSSKRLATEEMFWAFKIQISDSFLLLLIR